MYKTQVTVWHVKMPCATSKRNSSQTSMTVTTPSRRRLIWTRSCGHSCGRPERPTQPDRTTAMPRGEWPSFAWDAEFPLKHRAPVILAEASGHQDIAPVHPEQLHHRLEPLPATARCQDQRGLDALTALSAVLAVGQTFQISEHVHRRARRKVMLNPLAEPSSQLGHGTIMSRTFSNIRTCRDRAAGRGRRRRCQFSQLCLAHARHLDAAGGRATAL